MQRRKILWLTSWYPNRNDRFDGDFIQRHARAAATEHDIHVLFVTEAADGRADEELHRATGLTEQLIYLPQAKGLFARVRKALRWKSRFQRAVADYIQTQGLPDLVHVHVPWKAGLIALWIKRKWKVPFLLSEHWGFYSDWPAASMQARLLTQIYTEAKAVVTVSKYLSQLIEKTTGSKVSYLIPNVVDTTLFRPGGTKYDPFTFIHVSNMMPVKNVDGIIDAFAALVRKPDTRPVRLVLVGNRDGRYVQKAKELGLLNDTVFFRNEIPYAEVAEEMRRAHAHVLFSSSETFSCVTAEALCCGLPVIATAAGALPELVHQNNGLLVPPNNVKMLTEAMGRLVNERFDEASIAAEAAQRWSYGAVAEAFDELYRRQAGGRAPDS